MLIVKMIYQIDAIDLHFQHLSNAMNKSILYISITYEVLYFVELTTTM